MQWQSSIFEPLDITLFSPAGIPTLNCVIHLLLVALGRVLHHNSVWQYQVTGNSSVSLVAVMMRLTSRSSFVGTAMRSLYLFSMLALSFVIFPALVLAQLTGELTYNWAYVFLPVWIVFAGWLFLPWVLKRVITPQARKLIGWSIFIWLPILIVSFLVTARLNGSIVVLQDMFIPFWILDGFLGIASFVAFISSLDDRGDRKFMLGLLAVLLVTLGVGLTSTILGSISDNDGRIDPIGFMLPMVITAALFAVAGCVVAVRMLRRARRDSFQSAWPYVCRCLCCGCRPAPPALPGAT
jgi:hypothetical protein